MVSALTILLLGCWLAGCSAVSGGGTDPTQPGQTSAPTPTCPGCTGPGGSESMTTKPSGQFSPTSAGVSAAVVILLLLVAFVCFRKIRARKRDALRLNSTSPMGALKAPAQEEHIYTSIDKGKKPQTPEPDSGADGLTYAELDGQALQGQRGGPAPAPEPAQTSEYAVINVSQGTPQ